VVTTYVLKCTIRCLMYGMLSMVTWWCSKQAGGEKRRLSLSAGVPPDSSDCPRATFLASVGPAEGERVVPDSMASSQSHRGRGARSACPMHSLCINCVPSTHSLHIRGEPGAGDEEMRTLPFLHLWDSLCMTLDLLRI
jgi:hypothetical protein